MLSRDDDPRWGEEEDAPDIAVEDDALSGSGLARAIQSDLAELRGICMGFARQVAAKAERQAAAGEDDELVRLNAAAAKAARAVRFIAVLQLEIDGQRQTPGTRVPAPANGNMPRGGSRGRRGPDGAPISDRDYERLEESETIIEDWLLEQHALIAPVLKADFIAADRPDAARQALVHQAKLVLGIPHPNLDACLKTLDPRYATYLFGEENVSLVLGPGPPGAWEDFDQFVEQRARGRRDQSERAPPSS